MKHYIKNKFTGGLVLLTVILFAGSCKKGIFYPGINDNPSQFQTPTPANLLPGIITFTGYEWGGDASRFTSMFMQQTTGTANQAVQATNYAVGTGDVDYMWTTGLYGAGILNTDYQLINTATATNQLHYEGIGKVLMANGIGLATDLWGDVPYSQAFQGTAFLNPVYDPQQQIYTTLDKLLTDAITELSATETTPQPSSDDVLYGGDLGKWTRFAHSLRAKFYLHLAKVDPANYGKALAEAKLGFSSATDNAGVLFAGASSTSQNPWYQFNTQRGDISFTGYIYNILNTANDPRASVYSDGAGNAGTLYGSQASTVYLITYDELLFIQAECYFQTSDKINAAITYNAAVAANLSRTVGSTTYAATVAKTALNITLANIMTQKYIANYLNPEVWTDWRRTGLPVLTPNPSGVLNGQIPRSLLYPSGEVLNNTSTPKNSNMLKHVYWDK